MEELYRGARLDAAAEWASRPDSDVTPLEREFIGAAVKQSESELEAVMARANAEAAGRRRTQRLATGLTAALVLALLAAGFAVRYERSANSRATDAKTARTVADANRLAALSPRRDRWTSHSCWLRPQSGLPTHPPPETGF